VFLDVAGACGESNLEVIEIEYCHDCMFCNLPQWEAWHYSVSMSISPNTAVLVIAVVSGVHG